jgi:hypothetical protein
MLAPVGPWATCFCFPAPALFDPCFWTTFYLVCF